MKNAHLKIAPKNVPHKMPENPAMARVRTVRKGTKKGTQITQIQVRKVRKTKPIQMRSFEEVKPDVARLTGSFKGTNCANCELCDNVRIENCELRSFSR